MRAQSAIEQYGIALHLLFGTSSPEPMYARALVAGSRVQLMLGDAASKQRDVHNTLAFKVVDMVLVMTEPNVILPAFLLWPDQIVVWAYPKSSGRYGREHHTNRLSLVRIRATDRYTEILVGIGGDRIRWQCQTLGNEL